MVNVVVKFIDKMFLDYHHKIVDTTCHITCGSILKYIHLVNTKITFKIIIALIVFRIDGCSISGGWGVWLARLYIYGAHIYCVLLRQMATLLLAGISKILSNEML